VGGNKLLSVNVMNFLYIYSAWAQFFNRAASKAL
jgi:hypothetical protein